MALRPLRGEGMTLHTDTDTGDLQSPIESAHPRRHGRRGRRALALALPVLIVASCYARGTADGEAAQADLQSSVVTTNYPAARHELGPIAYQETPPMGGPHNPIWQNCGIYTAPIHNEHAVHSLEHGAVWITYRPDLPAADVERLRTLASEDYMLLSPYPELPAPVIASAWNHQIQLTGADDARLPAFIRQYKNNPQTTPEFGATCAGALNTTADADTLTLAGQGR